MERVKQYQIAAERYMGSSLFDRSENRIICPETKLSSSLER